MRRVRFVSALVFIALGSALGQTAKSNGVSVQKGPGFIYQSTTVCDGACIGSLYTTPMILVPACGPGCVVVPLSFAVHLSAGTMPFRADPGFLFDPAGSNTSLWLGGSFSMGLMSPKSLMNYIPVSAAIVSNAAFPNAALQVRLSDPCGYGNSSLTIVTTYFPLLLDQ